MPKEVELLQQLNSSLKQIKHHLQRHNQRAKEEVSQFDDRDNAENLINQLNSL